MLKLIVIQLMLATSCFGQVNEQQVTYLQAGTTHVQDALSLIQSMYTKNGLHIYCRSEEPLKFANLFQTIVLKLITKEPDAKFTQYKAATPQAIQQAHLEGNVCYEGKLMSGRTKTTHYITLSAHSAACYGIHTMEAYNLTMVQYSNDRERCSCFMLGLLLWMTAAMLCQCVSFCHYFVVALAVHLGSWAIVCVALISAGDLQLKSLQPVGLNFKLVLERYTTTVALALVFAAWLSYRFCEAYQSILRFKIMLKFVAYCLVFSASDHKYFGWICLALLVPHPELYRMIKWLRDEIIKSSRTWFPPKPRNFLTEEEFEAQARLETKHALLRHRQLLQNSSPSWEQMANLQSPSRFVRFVGSGDHLLEEIAPNMENTDNSRPMPDVALLEHLTTAINRSCPSALCCPNGIGPGTGAMRSLREDSRQY